jgi:hypothetical protein
LSPEEDLFVTSTARGQRSLLALALLVLMFRRLGRFVALHEVSLPVIDHVRRGLRLAPSVEPIVGESTLYRHGVTSENGKQSTLRMQRSQAAAPAALTQRPSGRRRCR